MKADEDVAFVAVAIVATFTIVAIISGLPTFLCFSYLHFEECSYNLSRWIFNFVVASNGFPAGRFAGLLPVFRLGQPKAESVCTLPCGRCASPCLQSMGSPTLGEYRDDG